MSTGETIPGIESVQLEPEVGQPTWVEVIKVDGYPPYIFIHKELIDPALYTVVRDIAMVLHCPPNEYAAYSRNWTTGKLELLDITTPLATAMVIVMVQGTLAGSLDRLATLLATNAQILPTRMVWPI